MGCAPRECGRPGRPPVQARLSLPRRVPTGSWEEAGSSAGRRRALPRGARGRSRGARALGSGRKVAAQVSSTGGALSPRAWKPFSGVSSASNRLQPFEAVGGNASSLWTWPGILFQTCSCDFCASVAEPRLRAQGRTLARLLGALARRRLGRLLSKLPELPGAGRETTQGKAGAQRELDGAWR